MTYDDVNRILEDGIVPKDMRNLKMYYYRWIS